MKRSRILWVLWLLLAAGYCLMRNDPFGYLLLFCSFLLPLLSGFLTGRSVTYLTADLALSAGGEKNSLLAGSLLLKNRGMISAGRLICAIRCENLLTGETERSELIAAVRARGQARVELGMKSRHAGRIRVTLETIRNVDPFGLFSFPVPLEREISAVTLVEPQMFGLEIQIAYGESTNMDSDEYSMRKAGFDPSETFAIREYRPGDQIRQIHWKLTEKFDDLMVRDYGLPIQNTILLLLETGRLPGSGAADPDVMDSLAEAVVSVAQTLSENQFVYSIGWQNHEEHSFFCQEIETEEDLRSVMPQLLGAAGGEDPFSVAEHYMETKEQLEFAHVIVFTDTHRANLSYLAEQCLLTEVVCGPGLAGYDQQDGIAVVEMDSAALAETLAYLEI